MSLHTPLNTMSPVLFLDIDGVLNSLGSVLALGDPSHHLDPVSIGLLARVCKETDAQIVVSSSWRIGRTVAQLQNELDKLGAWALADRFIDRTGNGHNGHRGKQIREWLQTNGERPYVIVDDDSDMLPEQRPYFVHTSYEDGFRAKHYREAMKILKPEHDDSKIILMADSL
jgi:hypothetical protein